MFIFYFTRFTCPSCALTLRGDTPWFGPAAVRCSRCKTVVQTGLPAWAGLPWWRKALSSAVEILLPTYQLRVVTSFLLIFLFVGFGIFRDESYPSLFLALIALSVLAFAYNLLRLMGMISQSNIYSRTGEPPEW